MIAHQIAFTDADRSISHVVRFDTLGAASNMVTLCGVGVLAFGSILPSLPTVNWPEPSRGPWCAACRAGLDT